MNKNIVHGGQSFLNKVVECTGDIENAFEMMLINKGITPTDKVITGQFLKSSMITDYDVFEYFTNNNRPATSIVTILNQELPLEYLLPGEFPYSF